MTGAELILVLNQVTKLYAVSQEQELCILKGVDLEIAAGSTLAIVGASGSGKSTLLNIMGTLDRATSGTMTLLGRDVAGLDENAVSHLRSSAVGFVFQLHHLLPQCTVLENVLVPTLSGAREGRREDAVARAKRLLDRVGLSSRLNHRPGQLSGGERQRTAVVRALINEPALLLADEPTGSLDRQSGENLVSLLLELNREEGVALVAVTHSVELAAGMSRVIELRDGRLGAVEGAQ